MSLPARTSRPAPGGGAPARRVAPGALALALALGAALLVSCGGDPPEILGLEWRLEYRPMDQGPAGGAAHESLSVFANVKDPDGPEDLEALWLVADGAELSWTMDASNWTRREEAGETWFGAAALAMPDFGALPRGEYRVVAADLAGRRVERPFELPREARGASGGGGPPYPLPRVAWRAGKVTVDSVWPETLILAYDGAGALLRGVAARSGDNELAALFGAEDAGRAATLASYGYDPARRIGAYSWKTEKR